MTLKFIHAALMLSAPALAEVEVAEAGGFAVESKAVVAASPERVYATLGQPSLWWDPAHTYSGDANQLSMALQPGGCFCERVPADNATIEHMRVVHASPGRLLRLQGGLGPLQSEAAAGTLTWALKAVDGGTEVTQTYVVGGFIRGGADKLAGPVDRVLGIQLERLKNRLAASP